MTRPDRTTQERRLARRLPALLAAALVSLAVSIGAAVPAAASVPSYSAPSPSGLAPAEVSEWDASHQNSSAAGTAEVVPYGFLQKTVTIEGDVTSSAADECYRVQLWAQHDLAGFFYDLTDHCGTGYTEFETEQRGMRYTSSFGIRLCRISHEGADAPTSCGPISWVG